jgi:hypothetical protein
MALGCRRFGRLLFLACSLFLPVPGSWVPARSTLAIAYYIPYLLSPCSNLLLSLACSLAFSPFHPRTLALPLTLTLTPSPPRSSSSSSTHSEQTTFPTITPSHPCRPHLTRSPNPTLLRLPGCRPHRTASTRIVVPPAWRRVLEPQLAFSGIVASLLLQLTIPVSLSSAPTPHPLHHPPPALRRTASSSASSALWSTSMAGSLTVFALAPPAAPNVHSGRVPYPRSKSSHWLGPIPQSNRW